jgi:hypothetical protein
LRIANPEPIVGSNVHHRVATLKPRAQGFRGEQIADMRLAANAFQIFQIACLADQETKVSALVRQRERNMVSNKSGSACKENLHSFCLRVLRVLSA